MTATFATHGSHRWPATSAHSASGRWRFARELERTAASPYRAIQWALRRNVSITPLQLGTVYASLCAVSLLIALGFWWVGAPAVLYFAGLELVCVGIALAVYARHAGDHETLTLQGQRLEVEQAYGAQRTRSIFNTGWLCVEPAAAQGSLVELSGDGQRVRVGRYLRADLRQAFAQELRGAVRRAAPPVHATEDELK
jgi:uncharacterized membrane protein